MVIVLLTAAGTGSRMGQDVPKQFLHVHDKPIIVHTMERFQNNPQVDAIAVATLPTWIDFVWAYAKQFGITKLKWITKGGSTGQESIRNGVYNLEDKASVDDVIIIHDGIRPLIEPEVLTDVISKAQTLGNAVTSMPYNEQIFVITPQAYRFGLLDQKYHEAYEKEIGIYGSHYTNTMMVELGVRLNFAAGSDKNIKLTTKDDLEMFKGYLAKEKDNWIK